MRSLLKIWVYSNIHIALIAFLLSLESNYLLGIQHDFKSPLFVFFSTLFIYNLGYYRAILFQDSAQRFHAEWMKLHVKYWVFSMLVSLIILLYLFSSFNRAAQYVIIFLSIISVLYIIHDLKFKGWKFSIRNIPYLKTFIVSSIWASITLLPQIFEYDLLYLKDQWSIMLLERFLFIFPIALMFDIRDLDSDPENLKTIAKSIGIRLTKIIAIISLLLGFYFYLKLPFGTGTNLLVGFLYVLMIISVLYSSKKREELYYSAWFDGLIGLHALFIIYQFLE